LCVIRQSLFYLAVIKKGEDVFNYRVRALHGSIITYTEVRTIYVKRIKLITDNYR
jgi:hypothetical protein